MSHIFNIHYHAHARSFLTLGEERLVSLLACACWRGSGRLQQGVAGIRLGHKGSTGYLNEGERIAVIDWIQQKTQRTLWEVIDHIENSYGVVYRSMQSYYELFKSAGMSWHKGIKKVPSMMNLWCVTTIK